MNESNGIYSLSPAFISTCGSVLKQACALSKREVALVEVVTTPDFLGRTILHVRPRDEREESLAELDRLVEDLRRATGPEYWVVLVSTCYKPFEASGIGPKLLEKIDTDLGEAYYGYPPTAHTAQIEQDGDEVRRLLGLPSSTRVWEIEAPVETHGQPEVRILEPGTDTSPFTAEAKLRDITCSVRHLPDGTGYRGVMKAYMRSWELGIGLQSYLIKAVDGYR